MRTIADKTILQRKLSESEFLSCFSFSIEQDIKLIYFDCNEFITVEGEELNQLYYLHSGKAKLFMTLPNGKTSLIDFFEAPCFIGEMELLGITQHARAVQTLTPCYCFALPLHPYRKILLEDGQFLRKLSAYLATKNMRNTISLSETKAFPLTNRLAAFILLASHHDQYQEMHTNVADYLGVSYRHLLYVLAQFLEWGYLEKVNAMYVIKNRIALEQLANEMKAHSKGLQFYANMIQDTN
jgi:CRP/FNR family putative post-exponential-phase nitrogen-starvation transcriptional regulator